MQLVNQTGQANNSISDPDKYALDLRFGPRHRLIAYSAYCKALSLIGAI